ncbi:hypothetical protein QQY66_30550 [Streptomyces sp. DG2A-72]|uniref:hypothetical protein n=1 Tax=Streptomyces sp. DG2A-72 TaxID=3051386 RepID=UPI00265B7760|nr:hypothetical protein [Streptomyces sp. DG2A-72]MDO0935814.1 hypothetical protein [Streptomyces sp. DG2A-72]
MRRRNRDKHHPPLAPATKDAIAITVRETITLVEIFEHAHARISELSDTDKETIADASGSTLIPSLFARVGLASIQGIHSIPLLAEEIASLEAAVINLESYEGNEVVLVAGYALLDDFANRKMNAHPLRHMHGVLAFADEAGDTASGPATPSLT